ncbi:MAG: hypothetical protein ACKV2Q_22360 [Planctomycetaceae bacterium]
MSSDQTTWTVKASFGAQWGPMSAETFLQMAADGSFASDDVARCGADGSWQPVAAALEELRSGGRPNHAAESEVFVTAPIAEMIAEKPTGSSDVANRSINKPVRRTSLPGWSNYWTPDSEQAASESGTRQFALTAESSSRDVGTFATTVETPDAEDSARSTNRFVRGDTASDRPEVESDSRFDELNAWKRDRAERLDRLLKIVAEREAAAAREAEAAKLAVAETGIDPINSVQTPPLEVESEGNTSQSVVPVSQSVSQSEPPLPPRSVAKRPENWEETLARWRRSVPDWRFVLPLLLLPWLAWHFWPVSNGSIVETYRSMYSDLRRLRDLPLNKTGMEEFVDRSQTQLDELLPNLKRRATPQNPDSQLLLWMARDCLKPMLKNPRQRNTKHEAMFKKLLAQWDSAHHIEAVAEPPETPESGIEPLPVSPSARPLGFGKSSEPAEPVDVELPPPSAKTKSKPRVVEDNVQN